MIMRIKKLLALVSLGILALLLFGSCAPDSIADNTKEKPNTTRTGISKTSLVVPAAG